MSQKCLQTKLSYESARKYFDVVIYIKIYKLFVEFYEQCSGKCRWEQKCLEKLSDKGKKICRKLSDY